MRTTNPLASALLASLLLTAGCRKDPAPSEATPPPAAPDAAAATTAPSGAAAEDAGAAPAPEDVAAAPAAEDVAAPAPLPVHVAGSSEAEPPEAERAYCSGDLVDNAGYFVATASGKIGGRVLGPEGAVVTIEGQKLTLGKAPASFEVDPLPLVLENGQGSSDLLVDSVAIAITWALPDGKTGGGEISCTSSAAIGKALGRVRRGPLKWAIEGEQRYKDDAILIVDEDHAYVVLKGDYSPKVYNADFIAFEHQRVRTLSPCHYDVVDSATGNRTGESVTRERSASDVVVEVYDRRSGRKIKSRTFSADTPECPDQLPMNAISAGGTLADPGEVYAGLLKEHPADGPDELGLPVPEVKITGEVPGTPIPETKLPPVPTIDKRFADLGYKISTPANRDDDVDGSKSLLAFADLTEDVSVTVQAHDWAPSKTPKDEYSSPVGYVVGGRTAVKITGEHDVIARILPVVASRAFATPAEIVEVAATAGYKHDGDVPTANTEPGLENWFFSFKKGDDTFLLEYTDWSDVADGKSTYEAVARSKDGFVTVSVNAPDKAREILEKLVK